MHVLKKYRNILQAINLFIALHRKHDSNYKNGYL